MLDIVFLLASLAPLIYGASLLVDSASSIAKKLDIPNIVIGLTIVAFGTSAPELTVNIFASMAGSSDITLGNIMGSNIFNILGILGISALIYPLSVKTNTTWIEIPLCLLSSAAVFILANDMLIDRSPSSAISRIDGLVLILFFIIFMSYNFQLMKTGSSGDEVAVKNYSIPVAVLLVIAGLILLFAGGRLIVFFAVRIAQEIGIPERIIGLTIISIGTSLPELATSAVAARKRNVDIAIGNIVGSNLFNAFFILGVSAVINPVRIMALSNMDMLVNIAASLLLFVFIFTGKGRRIDRFEGGVFIAAYITYLAMIIIA